MTSLAEVMIEKLGLPLSLFACILICMWVSKNFVSKDTFKQHDDALDEYKVNVNKTIEDNKNAVMEVLKTEIKNLDTSLADIKTSLREVREAILNGNGRKNI